MLFFFFFNAQYYLEVCKCYDGTVNSDICPNSVTFFFFFETEFLCIALAVRNSQVSLSPVVGTPVGLLQTKTGKASVP